MKNLVKLIGIIVLVVAIGFSMVACDDGNSSRDEYKLTWGLWIGETYSTVSSRFTDASAPLTPAGANAGYVTGSNASTAFSVIITTYLFDDGGFTTGSYENLVNFQQDGIGAPQDLKTAMLNQRNNIPLGGVYQTTIPGEGDSVIVYYLERN